MAVRGLVDSAGLLNGTPGAFLGSGEEALHPAQLVRQALSPGSRLTIGYRNEQGWNFSLSWLHLFDTLVVVVPAVILVLFLASMLAFAVSRYSFRFNLALLMLFTAGNLLPQQIVITPLYRLYLALPLPTILNDRGIWYDSFFGIMMIHIASIAVK